MFLGLDKNLALICYTENKTDKFDDKILRQNLRFRTKGVDTYVDRVNGNNKSGDFSPILWLCRKYDNQSLDDEIPRQNSQDI